MTTPPLSSSILTLAPNDPVQVHVIACVVPLTQTSPPFGIVTVKLATTPDRSVNGESGYGFILTAIDGQINDGGGVDKFRIKTWELSSEDVVYDNQIGASDTDPPSTTLDGGSIVIHTE